MGLDAVNVQVKIGSTTKNIQMEKGCMFENKGGKYLVDENGKLNVFDKNTNTWKQTSAINMTNYQFKAFQAVANNSNEGSGIILSKKDIELAQEKFRKGEFTADMSELLPDGYKIEKPKLSTSEKYVQAYVTNGKEKESATLKFQIAELADLKAASETYQAGTQQTNPKKTKTYKSKDGEYTVKEEYSPGGQLKKRTLSPAGGGKPHVFEYEYDQNNKLKATHYKHVVNYYTTHTATYDAKGRVTQIKSTDSDFYDTTYEYDDKNKTFTATNRYGTTKSTFNGRPLSRTDRHGGTIKYSYAGSTNGKPTKIEFSCPHFGCGIAGSDFDCDNIPNDYYRVENIKYDSKGDVISYIQVCNFTNAHEAESNYESFGDTYVVRKYKALPPDQDGDGMTTIGTIDSPNADIRSAKPASEDMLVWYNNTSYLGGLYVDLNDNKPWSPAPEGYAKP